jgi:hypothetical protein
MADGAGVGELTDEVPDDGPRASVAARLDRRFELFEAIVLAIAAVLTAWAAFQATKWSGVQADSYSRAGAARTESVRASTLAGQLSLADVTTFSDWVAALAAEQRAGQDTGLSPDGAYEPAPGSESGFWFSRFRTEFEVAALAWLAESPLTDPDAPATPFDMDVYEVAEGTRAAELAAEAEAHSAEARDANQRGDDYVLMTIVLALVLVLLGIGSKMDTFRARAFLFVTASVTLVGAVVVLATFPVEV